MPRLINLADHKNLWGATTAESGLEPQRNDLWLVDLTPVVNGLNAQGIFERLKLAAVPAFFPQLVQSVSLPELKMKPEVFRRDSVPFNMPSWDEPLDPVKITFLMDTYDNPNNSLVTSLLQAWQAVVRAGRGDRSSLYADNVLALPLNANYRYDYAFSLRIALLRGGSAVKSSLTDAQVQQMNQQMVNDSNFRNELAQSPADYMALTGGDIETASGLAGGNTVFVSKDLQQRPLAEQPWLQVASNWLLKDAWLASWKMSDLSYTDSKLVTVDAVLYGEDLYESTVP